jgi:hypothetical protein
MKQTLSGTDLPRTLESTFETIINRIKKGGKIDMNIALGVLSWVFHSSDVGVRPLKMAELQHLLNTMEGDGDIDITLLIPARHVIEVCQSLIVHDPNTGDVRVAHYTVQEFLCNYKELWEVSALAKICLTYLSFDAFNEVCQTEKRLQSRLEKYKAGSYVALFWGVFARKAEDDTSVQKATVNYLAYPTKRDSMLQMEVYAKRRIMNFIKGQTILHIIARIGLTSVCSLVFRGRPVFNDTYVVIDIYVDKFSKFRKYRRAIEQGNKIRDNKLVWPYGAVYCGIEGIRKDHWDILGQWSGYQCKGRKVRQCIASCIIWRQ